MLVVSVCWQICWRFRFASGLDSLMVSVCGRFKFADGELGMHARDIEYGYFLHVPTSWLRAVYVQPTHVPCADRQTHTNPFTATTTSTFRRAYQNKPRQYQKRRHIKRPAPGMTRMPLSVTNKGSIVLVITLAAVLSVDVCAGTLLHRNLRSIVSALR